MNRRNPTKRQKSATFAVNNLEINMLMIKNIVNLEIIATIMENAEVLHSICDLTYSIPK